MTDVRSRYVPPSIKETAFNCPHCGALAKQFWYSALIKSLSRDEKPWVVYPDRANDPNLGVEIEDEEARANIIELVKKMATGRPIYDSNDKYPRADLELHNVNIARCFNCDELSLWIYDRLMWPRAGAGPLPNPDLPPDIRLDYEEASTILEASPRGAAALLRLAIQKLCKHLGEKGDNINDDIGALVSKGLDRRVQQALDVVRVVGNNAVHPGTLDLRDDRATAEILFGLVNLITERMISQPTHVEQLYDKLLTPGQKAGIAARDGKGGGSK